MLPAALAMLCGWRLRWLTQTGVAYGGGLAVTVCRPAPAVSAVVRARSWWSDGMQCCEQWRCWPACCFGEAVRAGVQAGAGCGVGPAVVAFRAAPAAATMACARSLRGAGLLRCAWRCCWPVCCFGETVCMLGVQAGAGRCGLRRWPGRDGMLSSASC